MSENKIEPTYKKPGNPNAPEAGKPYRFQKGMSKVPGSGKKKGHKSLQARLNKYLSLKTLAYMPSGEREEMELIDALLMKMIQKAIKGELPAMQEILNRYYGKVADKVEMTGKDGDAMQIETTRHVGDIIEGMAEAFNVPLLGKKE